MFSDCSLCFPRKCDYNASDGVTNFPRKSKKTTQHERRSLVVVVADADGRLCLMQRPPTGLLANLLEFPSLELRTSEDESDTGATKLTKKFVEKSLSEAFQIVAADLKDHGEVVHQV